ncbi:Legumain [Halotydeus destructor]|nr:Legumain [Halotydeus destructor]
MMICVLAVIVFLASILPSWSTAGHEDKFTGTQWALLVASSRGFANYRHQADVYHAYHVLIDHGFPKSQIIVMHYNDVYEAPLSPTPGRVIARPGGPDVHEGVPLDYTGEEVNAENFLGALQGDPELVKRGKKVIQSTARDHIFIYYSGHGYRGGLAFETKNMSKVTAGRLNQVLQDMHDDKKYAKMVFYLESCESGSMFKDLLSPDIGIYAVTASNETALSHGHYCERLDYTTIIFCPADEFSAFWLEDTDRHASLLTETFDEQFYLVKRLTELSPVNRYGDLSIGKLPLAEFMGYGLSGVLGTEEMVPCSPESRQLALIKSAEEVCRFEDDMRAKMGYGVGETLSEFLSREIINELEKMKTPSIWDIRAAEVLVSNASSTSGDREQIAGNDTWQLRSEMTNLQNLENAVVEAIEFGSPVNITANETNLVVETDGKQDGYSDIATEAMDDSIKEVYTENTSPSTTPPVAVEVTTSASSSVTADDREDFTSTEVADGTWTSGYVEINVTARETESLEVRTVTNVTAESTKHLQSTTAGRIDFETTEPVAPSVTLAENTPSTFEASAFGNENATRPEDSQITSEATTIDQMEWSAANRTATSGDNISRLYLGESTSVSSDNATTEFEELPTTQKSWETTESVAPSVRFRLATLAPLTYTFTLVPEVTETTSIANRDSSIESDDWKKEGHTSTYFDQSTSTITGEKYYTEESTPLPTPDWLTSEGWPSTPESAVHFRLATLATERTWDSSVDEVNATLSEVEHNSTGIKHQENSTAEASKQMAPLKSQLLFGIVRLRLKTQSPQASKPRLTMTGILDWLTTETTLCLRYETLLQKKTNLKPTGSGMERSRNLQS